MSSCKFPVLVAVLFSIITYGQINSTVVVSQSGQTPSLSVDDKGNAFISWEEVVTSDGGGYGLIKKFAEYNSAGACLIPATSLPGEGYSQPRIIPGKDKLLWVWTQQFMETYAFCQLLNCDGTAAGDPYFVEMGTVSSGFANSDSSFTIVWSGYGGGVSALTYPKASSPKLLINRASLALNPIYLRDSIDNTRTLVWAVNETGGYNLYAKIFSAADDTISSTIKINTDSSANGLMYFNSSKGTVGETIIIWSSKKNNTWQVNMRVLSKTGELFNEQVISETSDSTLEYAINSVAVNEVGAFVVVWEANHSLILKYFNADGSYSGKVMKIEGDNKDTYQGYPNVVCSNSLLYLAWMDDTEIKMRILNIDTLFSGIGAVNAPLEKEPRFMLYPNYPNPFNPTTTISYQIPKAGYVSIKAYDAIGREVSTLLSEYKEQGAYSCSFNAANLASGMYFYTMKSGDYIAAKKMLLLK
jgi:hypothetical protein